MGAPYIAVVVAFLAAGLVTLAALVRSGRIETPRARRARKEAESLEASRTRLLKDNQDLLAELSRVEREKERISELYLRKLESSKRRAEELRRILEVGNSINSHLDLDLVLTQVVNAARECLGFRIVLLRILNEQEHVLEAKAFAGLDEDAMNMLSASRIPEEQFRSWMREEFRISGSYFISHTQDFWSDDDQAYVPDLGERGEGEWHQDDVLFVPLWTPDRKLLGYLSVDDPVDRMIPDKATIEMLEVFASQAVTAIQNARLYTRLERNMREIEEAAERMKELNELKSNFVATVSHELRTPLTSITAYVQTLMKYLGTDNVEMQREFLGVINEESNRLASLIDAILDLSRLEAGKSRIKRDEFDAVELVQETAAYLRPEAEKKRIIVKGLPEHGHLKVEGDRDLMKQALLNIAGNAVKFSLEEGTITISVRDDGASVSFVVEDTGIGIPANEVPKIFERFYQVDNSATRQFGGPGLGLAVAKAIVEWHGGTIDVDSEVGRGSAFTVSFPRIREESRVFYNPNVGEVFDPQSAEIIKEIVRMISEIVGAKTVSLMVVKDGELSVLASLGLSEHVARSTKCRIGDGVAGWVASKAEPILVKDVYSDPRFASSPNPAHTSRSVIAVPIVEHGEVRGVLNANSKDANSPLTDDDLTLLCSLADMLVVTWARARTLSENQRVARQTLSALRSVVEHTRLHKARLSGCSYYEWTLAVAREIGLSEEDVRAVGYAAAVHDVGMKLLGDKAVEGGEEFSKREFEFLRDHPVESARMVIPLDCKEKVVQAILTHHERYDGSGYPAGLRGEEIPIGGRIIAVMDAFDAMAVGRPYRESMPMDEVVRELKSCSGSQFDPKVVEALVNILRARRLVGDAQAAAEAGKVAGAA